MNSFESPSPPINETETGNPEQNMDPDILFSETLEKYQDRLPEEFIGMWQGRVEESEDKFETIKNFESAVKKRLSIRFSFPVSQESYERHEPFLEKFRPAENVEEKLSEIKQEAMENGMQKLGQGRTAEVFVSNIDSRFCYKIITNSEEYETRHNSVDKEMEFLEDLTELNLNVRIPVPYYAHMDSQNHLYIMESLKAVSLKDILENRKEPFCDLENLDLEKAEKDLQDFVEKMHQLHIYHRDLHTGNVMLDKKGNFYIIDFGSAAKYYGSNPEEIYRDKQIYKTTDKAFIKQHIEDLKQHVKEGRQS